MEGHTNEDMNLIVIGSGSFAMSNLLAISRPSLGLLCILTNPTIFDSRYIRTLYFT